MLFFLFVAAVLPPGLEVKQVDGINAVRISGNVSVYRSSGPTRLLFETHARRDVVGLASRAETAVVPQAEEKYFSNPQAWWDLFWESRFHDYDARHSKWPSTPIGAKQIRGVKGGDLVEGFEVLDTPGYTAGAVSYLATIGGKRVAFTGDLIYYGGRLNDLYSLQDSVPEAVTSTRVAGRNTVRGYHGFAARAADLMESLRRIDAAKPDLIVPARGPVIEHPHDDIQRLLGRLEALMREHFATDALRWYWGDDNLRTRAKRMIAGEFPWMEMAATRKLPEWILPIQNSKLIISKSGGALLVDCGYEKVYETVEKLRAEGRFQKLEAIYVTHYHDDHTDYVAEAAKRSGNIPVWYSAALRDVLENPGSYKLPAMTRNPIPSGEALPEGHKRKWHEFDLEFAFFPGQTLYHGVMVLSRSEDGTKVVFGGDSFTPSGMDDYCLLNRNLTGENQGYRYCLRYLRKLGSGVYLTNQHVDPMWTYTPAQLDYMEKSLIQRTAILRELFPYDSPNYGVDEQWARMYPYGSEVKPGASVPLEVRLTNHSPKRRTFTVVLHTPQGWKPLPKQTITLAAGADGVARFPVQVPEADQGLRVITASIDSGDDLRFPGFVEALLHIR